MDVLRWIRSIFLLFLTLHLSGCVNGSMQQYAGIPPVLDATGVEQSSTRIDRIISALARDTRGGSYYEITEAGFNYVDDRCMEYFNELFYLNRRREAIKAGLNAFSQTSNAILVASGTARLTIGAVAQAFGLSTSLTDIAAGSYLYQLPPATTLAFVRKLQGAYREGVAAKSVQIGTPSAAYHLIQDYLSLCLPPVIEAKLVGHIADAAVVPVSAGSVSNIEVEVGSNSRVDPQRQRISAIQDVRKPADPIRRTQEGQRDAIGTYEPRLSLDRVKRIQLSLCVSPADGRLNNATRTAVDEFFRGVQEGASGRTYPIAHQEGIQAVHEDKLLQAEREVRGTCDPSRDKNALEIGRRVS